MKKLLLIGTLIILPLTGMKRLREESAQSDTITFTVNTLGALDPVDIYLNPEYYSTQMVVERDTVQKIPLLHDMLKFFPETVIDLSKISQETFQLTITIIEEIHTQAPILKLDPDFFETYTLEDIPLQVKHIVKSKIKNKDPRIIASLVNTAGFLQLEWLQDAIAKLWVEKELHEGDAQASGWNNDSINYISKYTKDDFSKFTRACSIADIVALGQLPSIVYNQPTNQQVSFNELDLSGRNIINLVGIYLIPERLKITMLNLKENIIRHVPNRAFESLSELNYLKLEDNYIDDIAPYAFHGINKLQFLNLASNAISKLSADMFADIPLLKKLYLEFNNISLPDNIFINLSNVWYLNLNNNPIRTINERAFAGLAGLMDLDLSECSLDFIDDHAFHNLPILEDLNLNNNNLTEINDQLFTNNHHLISLWLSDNKISRITPGAFTGLNLDELSLEGNRLDQATKDRIAASLPDTDIIFD
ncbi:MAG TPA: leucine-rich repeat domain-containing protein [Candidatus Dependentiae bacterium]|nr:leucine-rich repeat domain-containing protein [Candidatus Dependentiae bacterium]HRQ62933.1 leucine-rich repeat domain-containing protein [Candidatus Dependentiae bacterium]